MAVAAVFAVVVVLVVAMVVVAGFCTPFLLRWGPGPPQFFKGGGGGLFNPRGPLYSLGQISILKIIIFL